MRIRCPLRKKVTKHRQATPVPLQYVWEVVPAECECDLRGSAAAAAAAAVAGAAVQRCSDAAARPTPCKSLPLFTFFACFLRPTPDMNLAARAAAFAYERRHSSSADLRPQTSDLAHAACTLPARCSQDGKRKGFAGGEGARGRPQHQCCVLRQ